MQKQEQGEPFVLGRRPALDGLRAVAAVTVVTFHILAVLIYEPGWHFAGGYIGVDMFFVLSGFLITSLLIQENERGGFRLRGFYKRRSMRLFPALAVLIAAQIVYVRVHFGQYSANLRALTPVLFYIYNWNFSFSGGAQTPFGLTHTWSLAVEEQFYLLWPLLLYFLLKLPRRWVMAGMVTVFLAAVIARTVLFTHFNPLALYWQTESHVDELMVGAIAATALQWGWKPGRWIQPAAWAGVALLVWTVRFGGNEWELLLRHGGLTIISVGIVCIILATLEPKGVLHWMLSRPPIRFVGRISYSLYLWHVLVLTVVATSWPHWSNSAKALVVIGASLGCAVCSYYLIELPFVRLAHHTRVPHVAATEPVLVTVGPTIPRTACTPALVIQPPAVAATGNRGGGSVLGPNREQMSATSDDVR